MVVLVADMRLHANEQQTVEELTWTRPVHDGKINSKTELRDNQNGKCTTD